MAEEPKEPAAKRLAAAVRRLNRHPRLVESTRQARQRAMGDDELADRLSTARGRPADLAARQLATFRGAEPGLLGELGMSVLQAWQRLAESQDRGRGKVDVVILFTDLVGFSSWALEAGDRRAVELLRQFSAAAEPPIQARRGEVVKRLGDGLMGAFWDADSAVEAAFAIHEQTISIEVDGYHPQLRTGIHIGRPRKLGGDYLGVDVNIAARLAEAAKPGEVLVSGPTLEAIDSTALAAKSRRFRAKGAPANLTAHAVRRD